MGLSRGRRFVQTSIVPTLNGQLTKTRNIKCSPRSSQQLKFIVDRRMACSSQPPPFIICQRVIFHRPRNRQPFFICVWTLNFRGPRLVLFHSGQLVCRMRSVTFFPLALSIKGPHLRLPIILYATSLIDLRPLNSRLAALLSQWKKLKSTLIHEGPFFHGILGAMAPASFLPRARACTRAGIVGEQSDRASPVFLDFAGSRNGARPPGGKREILSNGRDKTTGPK